MPLRRLTANEMIQLSNPWVNRHSDDHQRLQAIPEIAALLPYLEDAHQRLVSALPAYLPDPLKQLSLEASRVDLLHDSLARGIYTAMSGFIMLSTDQELIGQVKHLLKVIFPEGLSIIQRPYREEASEGALVDARVGAEDRAVLARLPLPEGDVKMAFENWMSVARRLGKIEDQRAKEAQRVARVATADLVKARNKWIRAVTALVSYLDLLPHEEAVVAIINRIRNIEHHSEQQELEPTVYDPEEPEVYDPEEPAVYDPEDKVYDPEED